MEHRPAPTEAAISVLADDTGVVWLQWAPGQHIDEARAARAMRLVDELNGGRRRPLYVDMTGTAGVTRGARKVFMRPCTASRIALVGRSAVDRVLATFALGVTPIPAPTRFYTDAQAALDWLRDVV